MDLDDELRASDPFHAPDEATRAAIVALVAEAEEATGARPRRRLIAIAGGVAGAIVVGGGVAQATGVPVLSHSTAPSHPSCSVTVLKPLTGAHQPELSLRRVGPGVTELRSLMAKQDGRLGTRPTLRATGPVTSSKQLRDLVQRLEAAQKKLDAACPRR